MLEKNEYAFKGCIPLIILLLVWIIPSIASAGWVNPNITVKLDYGSTCVNSSTACITVNETDASFTHNIPVRRSNNGTWVHVDYKIISYSSNGIAAESGDFDSVTRTRIDWEPSDSNVMYIPLRIHSDADTDDEEIIVELIYDTSTGSTGGEFNRSPGGASLANPTKVIVKIIDDEDPTPPTVSFNTPSSTSITEDASSSHPYVDVQISPQSTSAVTVNYSISRDGSQGSGDDFYIEKSSVELSGSFSIPANTSSARLYFYADSDNIYDPNEGFDITLSSLSGGNENEVIDLSNDDLTFTISDTDGPPTITIDVSNSDSEVDENATTPNNAVVTFKLSRKSQEGISFEYDITDIDTNSTDYTASPAPTTLWIAYPDDTTSISIDPNDSIVIYEGDEVLRVSIENENIGTIGSPSTFDVTILENESVPVAAIGPPPSSSIDETDRELLIPTSLTVARDIDASFSLDVEEDSLTDGNQDYWVSIIDEVGFDASQTPAWTKSNVGSSVSKITDLETGRDVHQFSSSSCSDYFTLSMGNSSTNFSTWYKSEETCSVLTATLSATIDGNSGTYTFDYHLTDGTDGYSGYDYNFYLGDNSANNEWNRFEREIIDDLLSVNGSATYSINSVSDIKITSSDLYIDNIYFLRDDISISAGITGGQDILVEVADDNRYEANQDFEISVDGTTNCNVPSPNTPVVITVTSDETAPEVSFASGSESDSVTEGGGGTLTVELDKPSELVTTVELEGVDGTAVQGGSYPDYSISEPLTLTFVALDQSEDISFSTNGDNRHEDNESFAVELASFTNSSEGSPSVSNITITDDDDPSQLSVSDESIGEDAGTVTLTFTLDRAAGKTASFGYSTTDGTAVSSGSFPDYVQKSDTVSFVEGESSKDVTITIVNEIENLYEDTETFTVSVASVTTLTGLASNPVVTINDDDPVFTIPVKNATVDNGTLLRLPGRIPTGISEDSNLEYVWTVTDQSNSQSLITQSDLNDLTPLYTDYTTSTLSGNTTVNVMVTDTGNDDLVNSNSLVISNEPWILTEEFSPVFALNGTDIQSNGTIQMGWVLENTAILDSLSGHAYIYGQRELIPSVGTGLEIYEFKNGISSLILSDEELLSADSYLEVDGLDRQVLLTWDPVSEQVNLRLRTGQDSSWPENPNTSFDNVSANQYNAQADVIYFNGWHFAVSASNASQTKLLKLNGSGALEEVSSVSGSYDYPSFSNSRNEILTLSATSDNSIEVWHFENGASSWSSNSSVSASSNPLGMNSVADAYGNVWTARAYDDLGSTEWEWFVSDFNPHDNGTATPDYDYYDIATPVPATVDIDLPSTFTLMLNRGSIASDNGGYIYLLGNSSINGAIHLARLEPNDPFLPTGLDYDQNGASILSLSNRVIPGKSDSIGKIDFDSTGIASIIWQPSRFHDDSLYLLGRSYHNFIHLEDESPYSLLTEMDVAIGVFNSSNVEGSIDELLSGTGSISEVTVGSFSYSSSDWIPASDLESANVKVTVSDSPSGWSYDDGLRGVTVQHRTSSGRLLWPARDIIIYVDETNAQVKNLTVADFGEDGQPPLQPVTRDILKDTDETHKFGVIFEYDPPFEFNLNQDDVVWTAEGGIGVFSSPGMFRATGLGAGTVFATLERQNLSDFAYVFVGQPGEVAYFEIIPREETVLGLGERISLRAIGFDFGGNIIPDAEPYWEVEGAGQILQDGTYIAPTSDSIAFAQVRVSDKEIPQAVGTKPIYLDNIAPKVINFSVNGLANPEGQSLTGELVFHWELQQVPIERSMPVKYNLIMNDQIQIGSTIVSEEFTSDTLQIAANSISLPTGSQNFKIIAEDYRGNSNIESAPAFSAVIENSGGNPNTNAGLDWLLAHQYRGEDASYLGSWKNSFDRTESELVMEASKATIALGSSLLSYRASDPLGKNVHDDELHTVAQAYHDGIEYLVRSIREERVSNFMTLAMAHEALAGANDIRSRVAFVTGGVSATYLESSNLVNEFVNEVIDPSGDQYAATFGLFEKGEESRATRLETLLALRVLHVADRSDVLAKLLNIQDKNGNYTVYEFFDKNLELSMDEDENLISNTFENIAGWTNTQRDQTLGELSEIGESDSLYLSAETANLLLLHQKEDVSTTLLWLLDTPLKEFLTILNVVGDETGGLPAGAESVIDTASVIKFMVNDSLAKIDFELSDLDLDETSGLEDLSYITNSHYDAIANQTYGTSYWLRFDKQLTSTGSWNERAFDTAAAVEVLRPELLITQIDYDYAASGFVVEVANVGALEAQAVRVSLLEENAQNLVPSEIISRRKSVSFAETVKISSHLGDVVQFFIPYEPPVYPPLISLVVNAERAYAEYDYLNNTKTWELPEGPNLRLQEGSLVALDSSMQGLPLVGQPWILKARLLNLGQQPVVFRDIATGGIVNPSRLKIYNGDPRFDPAATSIFTENMADVHIRSPHGQTLGQLFPGESLEIAITIPEGVITNSGLQDIALWVDHASGFNGSVGEVRETDESDNIASTEIEFFLSNSTRERPDLTVDPNALSNDPNYVTCGEVTKLQLWVDNIGKAAAEDVLVEIKTDDFGNIQSYTIPFIGAKRSHLIEVPIIGGNAGQMDDLLAKNLGISVDPANTIDEMDERNNDTDYFMPLHCVGSGTNTNLAVFSENIDTVLKDGAFYPEASVINLGGSILDEELDVNFATRTYSQYRKPRVLEFNPYSSYNFPPEGFTEPKFSLPIGYANRFDTSLLSGTSPLNPAWVDIEVSLNPTGTWDSISTDNKAIKSIFTGFSDLRIVNIVATPDNEVTIESCSESLVTFDIKVTVANGSGESGFSDIKPVHLVLRNERNGDVLGAFNSIELEPVRLLSGGETLGLKTFTFRDVTLPVSDPALDSGGSIIDGEYRPHRLIAEIDPFFLFADLDDSNNKLGLPITVKEPEGGLTSVPPDFEIAEDDLRLTNENGYLVIAGTARYNQTSVDDCIPFTGEAAELFIPDGIGSDIPIPSSQFIDITYMPPGNELPFVLNTGIPASAGTPSSIEVAIEWKETPDAISFTDDSNPSNNRRTVTLSSPAAPECLQDPIAYASDVIIFWDEPAATTVDISSWLLRRFSKPADNEMAIPTLDWIKDISGDDIVYTDSGLLTSREYSYELYSRGVNSRLSETFCFFEIQPSSSKPILASIYDSESDVTHDVDSNLEPDRIFIQGFDQTIITVNYSENVDSSTTQTLKLEIDSDAYDYVGTPTFVTPVNPEEDSYYEYSFSIPAADPSVAQSSELAISYLDVSSGSITAKVYSNSAILIRDRMADLAFAYDDSNSARYLKLEYWDTDSSVWKNIPFHDFDVFIKKKFRIITRIENLHNQNIKLQDFTVLFEVNYKDGTSDQRLIEIEGDAIKDADEGFITISSSDLRRQYTLGSYFPFFTIEVTPGQEPFEVPENKEVDTFRISIDYDESQPLGVVQEINESNNELIKPYVPSFKPMGTEYLVSLPHAHYWEYNKDYATADYPSRFKFKGIPYKFLLTSQAKEDDNAPTIVKFFVTEPLSSNGTGIYKIETRDVEIGSIVLQPGERTEYILDSEFELENRSLVGTAWTYNTGFNWKRAIRIVGGRLDEDSELEAAEFSVTLFDPTAGEENSALLIPVNQLNDNYTVKSFYPSLNEIVWGRRHNVSGVRNVDESYPYTLSQYFNITTPAEEASVTITQNFLDVPKRTDFWGSVSQNQRSYTIKLQKGLVYTWAPFNGWFGEDDDRSWEASWMDPTGVQITSDQPIVVAAGFNAGIPSFDSRYGDHTYSLMHPSGVRGTDFLVPPPPYSLQGGIEGDRYSTSFVRVVPTTEDNSPTNVWLDAEEDPVVLDPGEFLEVTPINPFKYSNRDVANDKYGRLLSEKEGDEYKYVKRVETESRSFHRIKSDKPVLTTQYYISSQNLTGAGCRHCHYSRKAGGDPEMIPIIPKRAYSIDEYVSVSLAGGQFIDERWDPNRDRKSQENSNYLRYRPDTLIDPTNFITFVLSDGKTGANADDNSYNHDYEYPEIKYRRIGEEEWSDVTENPDSYNVMLYPRRQVYTEYEDAYWDNAFNVTTEEASGWTKLGWETPNGFISAGYQLLMLNIKTWDEESRHFEIWNPDNLPMMIMTAGFFGKYSSQAISQASSYGNTAVYRYVDLKPENKIDGVDLALSAASIRLPYTDEKIRAGERTPFLVEISNRGIENVESGDAVIQVFHVQRDEEGLDSFIPILPQNKDMGNLTILPESLEDSAGYIINAAISAEGHRVVGWLADDISNPAILNDENFVFTPTEETVGLHAYILYKGGVEELVSNNFAERPLEFKKPELMPRWVEYRRPDEGNSITTLGDRQPGFIDGTASPSEVNKDEQLDFVFQVLSTELYDDPVKVRYTIEKPNPRFYETGFEFALFNESDVVTIEGDQYFVASFTVPITHEMGGRYFLSAIVDADNTIVEVNESNNASDYFYDVDFPSIGNLVVENLRFKKDGQPYNSSTFYENDTVTLEADLRVVSGTFNDAVNEIAYFGNPGTTSAVQIGSKEESVDSFGPSVTSITISKEITFTNTYQGFIFLTGNIDEVLEESNYRDNKSGIYIEVLDESEKTSPDLVAGRARISNNPAYRTEDSSFWPTLSMPIVNSNTTATTGPFKVQVFLNSKSGLPDSVIAESIFEYNGTPQSMWYFEEVWDTSDVELGDNELTYVIDSPNHLAALGESSANNASRQPLVANQLRTNNGIKVFGLTDEDRAANIRIRAYAAPDDEYTSPNTLLGSWSVSSGFSNQYYDLSDDLTSDVLRTLRTDDASPILLVFDTLTTDSVFPIRNDAFEVTLSLNQLNEFIGTTTTVDIPVSIPSNRLGGWGEEAAFWVANDGSSYFALQLHLSSDFSGGASDGEFADMSATFALNDSVGAVPESDDFNNNRREITVNILPRLTDLTVALSSDRNEVGAGETINFNAEVTNDGIANNQSFNLVLDIYPIAGQSTPVISVEELIVGPVEYGTTRTLGFEWSTSDFAGDFIATARVDTFDDIDEGDETNNSASVEGTVLDNVTLTVSASPLVLSVDQLSTITMTVDSDIITSGILYLSIIDPVTNELIESDLTSGKGINPFHMDGLTSHVVTWNTDSTPAGEYVAEAILGRRVDRGFGNPIVVQSNTFEILPDKNLNAFVTTSKKSYDCGDPIKISGWVENISRNFDFDELDLVVTIEDNFGNVYPVAESALEYLTMNRREQLSFTWNEPLLFSSDLTVNLEVNERDGLASATSSYAFSHCGTNEFIVSPDYGLEDDNEKLYTTSLTNDLENKLLGLGGNSTNLLVMVEDGGLLDNSAFIQRNIFPNAGFVEDDLSIFQSADGSNRITPSYTPDSGLNALGGVAVSGQLGDYIETREYLEGFSIVSNASYVLSFYAINADERNLEIEIVETDADAFTSSTILGLARVTDEWQRYQFSFNTQEASDQVALKLNLKGSSDSIWILDQFQIESGRVASPWTDHVPASSAIPMLANSSLVLDEARLWNENYPSLSESMDESVNSLPDAWDTISLYDAVSIVSDSTLPEELERLGLTQSLSLDVGSTSTTLRQGRVSVDSESSYLLSVYAKGDGVLSQIVRFYDDQDQLVGNDAVTTFTLNGSSWVRAGMNFTTPANAIFAELDFSVTHSSDSTAYLVAAQLEPGDSTTSWKGFVPYFENYNDHPFADSAEGIYSISLRGLSSANQYSTLASMPLMIDANVDGVFDGIGTIDPSYTVTTLDESENSQSLAGSDLFDEDLTTGLLLEQGVETAVVEWQLPTRPSLQSLVFEAAGIDSGANVSAVLEGRFIPGTWTPIDTLVIADGLNDFGDLGTVYSAYRLMVSKPVGSNIVIGDFVSNGFVHDAIDTLVYDITEPSGSIISPTDDSLVIDSLIVEVMASDNLSGVAQINLTITDSGIGTQNKSIHSITEDGSFNLAFDISELAEGEATISGTVVDHAGNIFTLASVDVLIDWTAPVLSNPLVLNLTTSNNSWHRNSENLELRVTTDELPSTAVLFMADLAELGYSSLVPADSFDNYEVVWSLGSITTNVHDGLVEIPLSAKDDAGNISNTVIASIVIDNTAPTVEMLTALDVVAAMEDTLDFEGIAYDNPDGVVDEVVYSLDGGSNFATNPDDLTFDQPTEYFSFSAGPMVDGTRCIVLSATDAAGNIGTSIPYCFDVDAGGPVIEDFDITDVSINSDRFIRSLDDARVDILFGEDSFDPETVLADFSLLGFSSSTLAEPSDSDPRAMLWNLYSVDTDPMDGLITISTNARDYLGRATSATATIIADNTKPVLVSFDGPELLTSNTIVTFTGVVQDSSPGLLESVEYRLRNSLDAPSPFDWSPVPDSPDQWTTETRTVSFNLELGPLQDGTYVFELRANDMAKWDLDVEDGIYEHEFAIDTLSPDPSLILFKKSNSNYLSSPDYIKNGDQVKFSLIANDTTVTSSTIYLDMRDLHNEDNPWLEVNPDEYNINVAEWFTYASQTSPSDGVTTFTARVVDYAGLEGFATVNTIADNTSPTIVALELDESQESVSLFGRANIRGVAFDPLPGIIKSVQYRNASVSESSWRFTSFEQDTNISRFSALVQLPGDGTYDIEVRAIDGAGNISDISSIQIVLDNENSPSIETAGLFDGTINSEIFTRDTNEVVMSLSLISKENVTYTTDTIAGDFSSMGGPALKYADALNFPFAYFDLGEVDSGNVTSPVSAEVWIETQFGQDSLTSDTIIFDNIAPVASFVDGSEIFVNELPEVLKATLDDDHQYFSGPRELVVLDYNGFTTYGLSVNSEELFTSDSMPIRSDWEFDISVDQDLEDGIYTWQIGGLDIVGNEVETSPTLAMQVDRTSPTAVLSLVSPSLTNQIVATLNADVADNLLGSGVETVEYQLNADGNWVEIENLSLPAIGLTFNFDTNLELEDENTVFIRVTDRAGNSSISNTVTIDRDTIAPIMAIDSPTSFTWTNDDQVVSWHQVTNETVTDYNVLELTTFADATTTRSVENLESISDEGRYLLNVWGVDLAGNAGLTTSTAFGIDLTSPTIEFDQEYSIHGVNYLSLTGSTSDSNQSGVSSIYTSLDGDNWTSETFNMESGVFTASRIGLAEGVHTLQAKAVDVAGNESLLASSDFIIDLSAPVLTVDTATQLDGLFLHRIEGTISDALTTPTSIDWSIDQSNWSASTLNISAGTYQFNADLETGNNTFYVRGYDSVYNVGYASNTFYLDDVSPIMHVDSPTTGTWYNEPVSVTWSAEENDAATSETIVLYVPLNGDSSTTQTLTWGEYVSSEGLYFVDVIGTDKYGNVSDPASVEFGVDSTSPTITLNTASPTNDDPISITGLALDQYGSGINILSITENNGPWNVFDSLTAETGILYPQAVEYDTTLDLEHGENQPIAVQAIDAAGNSSVPTSGTVSVDLISPEITIDDPSTSDTLSGTAETISTTITDEFVGVDSESPNARISWAGNSEYFDFDEVTTGTFAGTLNTWRYGDGPALLTFTAADTLGNNATNRPNEDNPTTMPVTINNLYPPMAPSGIRLGYISYTEVEIIWNKNTEDDLSHYLAYRRVNDGNPITSSNLLNSGSPEIYDTEGELYNSFLNVVASGESDEANNPGYWDFALRSVDLAGNESLLSKQITVVAPDTPGNLLAIGKDDQVDLSWIPVTENFVSGYKIYRREVTTPESSFAEIIDVSDALTSSTVDSDVTNGTTYEYVVYAYDGAENLSKPSNEATATPNTGDPTIRQKAFVLFESWSKYATNDWDYEDLGVRMDSTIELDEYDNVSTITITMEGFFGYAGSTHNVFLDFVDLVGTADYEWKFWEDYEDPSSDPPSFSDSDSYYWQGLKTNTGIEIFPDTNGKVNGVRKNEGSFDGSIATLVVGIDDPASNPITNFDKAPFDMHIYNISTDIWIYLYDPDTGDHFDDNQIVPETYPELYGTYLNGVIVVPDFDYVPSAQGQPIWVDYPDFIDYARTYRSSEIKNRNWYSTSP